MGTESETDLRAEIMRLECALDEANAQKDAAGQKAYQLQDRLKTTTETVIQLERTIVMLTEELKDLREWKEATTALFQKIAEEAAIWGAK